MATYDALGRLTSFTYTDINSFYRSGQAPAIVFDMQTFMSSSASNFVRPTSFSAFAEVRNYVRDTGQAITFEQYFTNKGAQLGYSGADLTDYVAKQVTKGFQRYFDGDFSADGMFNKYVWGSP